MKSIKSNLKHISYPLLLLIFISSSIIFSSCSSSVKDDLEKTDDPEAAFNIAHNHYLKKDYLQAVEDFSVIKLRFSGSKIIDKAVYYLGLTYIARKENLLAAYEFEQLLKNYPGSEYAVQARYQLGMSYYNESPEYNLDQTYTQYAINEFKNFIDLYPNDPLSTEAAKKITELKNKLAFKLIKDAEQYATMNNYRAATIYYDLVLDQYFDTDWADDALYNKINMLIIRKKFPEAEAEIKRFEQLFKGSELLRKVEELKNRI
ncbi:outer membrane protein assembly factor BamD [soil metagenome]